MRREKLSATSLQKGWILTALCILMIAQNSLSQQYPNYLQIQLYTPKKDEATQQEKLCQADKQQNGKDQCQQIVKNGELQSQFNSNSWSHSCCSPPPIYTFFADQEDTKKGQVIIVLQNSDEREKLEVSQKPKVDSTTQLQPNLLNSQQHEIEGGFIIQPQQEQLLTLKMNCPESMTENNYWSQLSLILQLDQSEMLTFSMIVVCQKDYRPPKFDWSLPLLIVLASAVVGLLASFEQFISIKNYFSGWVITYVHAIAYVLVASVLLIVGFFSTDAVSWIFEILSYVLGFICCFIFLNEIITRFDKKEYLRQAIIWQIRIQDVICCLFASTIVVCWILFQKPWYLNDIMSICIVGVMLKLFKITSLRSALIIFAIIVAFEISAAAVIHYVRVGDVSYDAIIISDFNFPGIIQLRAFKERYMKICSWLPITICLFPGFFLAFCARYDEHRKSYTYTIVSFMGLLIGMLTWMVSTVWNKHSWPISAFAFTMQIVFVALYAYFQSQIRSVWEGNFHDSKMLEPHLRQLLEEKAQLESTQAAEGVLDKGIFASLAFQKRAVQLSDTQLLKMPDNTGNGSITVSSNSLEERQQNQSVQQNAQPADGQQQQRSIVDTTKQIQINASSKNLQSANGISINGEESPLVRGLKDDLLQNANSDSQQEQELFFTAEKVFSSQFQPPVNKSEK